jgi:diacylglycerol kinase (ATP)
MRSFLQTRSRSFHNAFAGVWYVIRTQKNAWIHTIATLLVILFAIWLNITITNWAILILAMGLVWTAECINTALESIVDLASPRQHPLAKIGKDVGAAAVVIAAFSSVIVGFLILGPPLWDKLSKVFNQIH